MHRVVASLSLALILTGSAVRAGEWIASPQQRIHHALHQRLELYLRALHASPEEQEKLKAQDPAQGIWLMQLNPFLRARLELVGLLSAREREDLLLNGRVFVSEPYGKLPRQVQSWMSEALGVDQFVPATRNAIRYQLQCRYTDGALAVMINQVDPMGRPRSGGSVMPGILAPQYKPK